MRGSTDNLIQVYRQARNWELQEGAEYYHRQRARLARRAVDAGLSLQPIAAAFAALSPNNTEKTTYIGLDTCLDIVAGRLPEDSKVTAYGRNRTKAMAILRGASIEDTLSGLKVNAFYQNTINPLNDNFITIDGHMLGAWVGKRLVLKRGAQIKNAAEYHLISSDFRSAAQQCNLPAITFQATLWLTWKRLNKVNWSEQTCFSWVGE